MALSFGTDGVRGDAASELTDPFVRALGRAAVEVLGASRFVVGRDTRESGERVEAALASGLAAAGPQVDLVGVVPTPGVAFLAGDDHTAGAMISASHNPWSDNGIKLFASGGRKLGDETEQRLEAVLQRILATDEAMPSTVDEAGPIFQRPDLVGSYRSHLLGTVDTSFEGLTVVLDCANGASSTLAPDIFRALGASVQVLHAEPDGRNINDGCGSTHPDDVQQLLRGPAGDLGLAFDGDADRVVAVDEHGGLVDGDHLIGMCAIDRRDRGVLVDDTVVITVMSNLGFRRGMADRRITVLETPVGDRHVLEALDRHGLSLGGEQSGHVIFRDLATTGDGILTGLQVCDLLMRTGRFLSDLAATAMTQYPQVLRNVRVAGDAATMIERLSGAIAAEEQGLGSNGRVLVRASGTEPLVRVMVEASSAAQAEAVADRLAAAVQHLAP